MLKNQTFSSVFKAALTIYVALFGPGPRVKHLGLALGHPGGSAPGEWTTELIPQKMLSLYVFIREAVNNKKKEEIVWVSS